MCMRHGWAAPVPGGITVPRLCLRWLSWDGADWGMCVYLLHAHNLLVFTWSLRFLLSVLPFAEIQEMAVTQPMLPFPGDRIALSNRQAVPLCSLTSEGQYDCGSAFTV